MHQGDTNEIHITRRDYFHVYPTKRSGVSDHFFSFQMSQQSCVVPHEGGTKFVSTSVASGAFKGLQKLWAGFLSTTSRALIRASLGSPR